MRLYKLIHKLFFLILLSENYALLNAQITPKKEGDFRIAVLGCIKQFEPLPAFSKYLNTDPDLCLWIGDNVYADAPDDPSFIKTCYDSLLLKPGFSDLRQYDLMATWDDHDFGLNDAGKNYPFKEESKRMFREFWGLSAIIPENQDGIYYSRNFDVNGKNVQIIMLDVRYNRDDPDTNGDVLGEPQWNWFAKTLEKPANLRIVVSGFQILLDRHAGSETWDRFPVAKQRLFNTIKVVKAENLIFLTGDQHYGEVCRTRNTLDFDAIELQFAGVNQIEAPEFNPARVSPVIKSKHSVALIDIQMETSKEDVPHLLFQIMDATTNHIELTYRVNLDEIGLQLHFTEQKRFSDRHQVHLSHSYPNLEVRYTLDGSDPLISSPLYTAPITIDKTTKLKARLFTKEGESRSNVFISEYVKMQPIVGIKSPKNRKAGLRYAYYEGDFQKLPDFKSLKPVKKGITTSPDLNEILHREDHFAIQYWGQFKVPETGVYEFYLVSDDGSKLRIAGDTIIDNDGSHSARMKTGVIALEKGWHPIEIEYFDDYEGQSLVVGYTTQDGKKITLQPGMLAH